MTVNAYAKVNFTLEVFDRRPDGYHALRSLVLPISLADEIEVEKAAGYSSDSGYDDDLMLKAARVLGAGGVRIHVKKRIPAGGGLGGGSADAAAVLRALNGLYGLGLSRAELAEVGAQVGSDVPALVMGGPVVMEGRGEVVSRVDLPRLDFVVAHPGVASSTAAVYARCRARERRGPDLTRAAIAAVRVGGADAIASAAVNDLQGAAIGLHPEIAEAMRALTSVGAVGVTMSGSGSCIFGLADGAERAREISAGMNALGFAAWNVRTMSAE